MILTEKSNAEKNRYIISYLYDCCKTLLVLIELFPNRKQPKIFFVGNLKSKNIYGVKKL